MKMDANYFLQRLRTDDFYLNHKLHAIIACSMEFTPHWNLASIPDEYLKAEWARRSSAQRKTFGGGRPPVSRGCPFCSQLFSAGALRAHTGSCRHSILENLKGHIVTIVPTFDDPYANGFVISSVSREMVRLEKCGFGDNASLPVTAICGIDPEHYGRHATLGLAGKLAFSSKSRQWEYTPGLLVGPSSLTRCPSNSPTQPGRG